VKVAGLPYRSAIRLNRTVDTNMPRKNDAVKLA
jgi:hypothetical protein